MGLAKYKNLFCADYTAYGDGVYGCNGDGVYSNVAVDSGMLGIVVLDDETKLQPGFMANLSSSGVIFRGSNVKLVADNGVFKVYSGGKLLFESDTREEDEDFSF